MRLALLASCLVAATALGAQVPFRGWIGVYESDQIGVLENENRLAELCPDAARFAACRAAALAPVARSLPLFPSPDRGAPSIGEIILVAVPGQGLSAFFRAAGSRDSVAFEPDLYLQDWGYGPYFHQTIAEARGAWYLLPAAPWPGPAWLHRPEANTAGQLLDVNVDDILLLRDASWVVVGAEVDALLMRPEQPADLWCEEGDPPALQPTPPTRFTRAQLLDARGHLLIRPKYMKGC